MSWGRLDDKFHSHRKVVDLGNFGSGLLARLISWSCDHKTGGRVTRTVCVTFANGDVTVAAELGIVLPTDYPDRLVDHLVKVGSLDQAGKGAYQIHDFDEYAKKAKAEKKANEKAAERMRNHRRNKSERYANDTRNKAATFGVTPGDPDPVSSSLRSEEPVPEPVPETPDAGVRPREAGGSEPGSDSSDEGEPSAPEPDPSRTEPEAPQASATPPTKAGLVVKLFDPGEAPPPANEAEATPASPPRDDRTLTLPGLETAEATKRPGAQRRAAAGARRPDRTPPPAEVATPLDEGEEEAAKPLTQEQRQAMRDVELAGIYSAAIREVAGGHHAVPAGDFKVLRLITTAHAPGLRLAKLDAWLAATARAYAKDRLPERRFEKGFCLAKFLEWLNAGGASAGAKGLGGPRRGDLVDPETGYVSGRDAAGRPVQGHDPEAPWVRASREAMERGGRVTADGQFEPSEVVREAV